MGLTGRRRFERAGGRRTIHAQRCLANGGAVLAERGGRGCILHAVGQRWAEASALWMGPRSLGKHALVATQHVQLERELAITYSGDLMPIVSSCADCILWHDNVHGCNQTPSYR
jgi:hypothetical protein